MKLNLTKPIRSLFLPFFLTGCTTILQAQAIQPYKAQEISVNANKSKTNTGAIDIPFFFGLYQYWVPGASYTIPDYANQQLVIHTSSGTGVLTGGIRINKEGSYMWNSSWDGKVIKGKWRATGDSGYPSELLKGQEGKNWKIGKATDKGVDIVVWDGSTWYNGKRIQ